MKTFADRLREKRQELGLSQAKLARLAGMTQGGIAQIEVGRNQNSAKVIDIAKALNVTPDWLLNGSESAGLGVTPYFQQADKTYFSIQHCPLAMDIDYLDKLKISPASICTFIQIDDSMHPTVRKNSYVFIDTSKNRLIENDLYLINRQGINILRRVAISAKQEIIYRCDNWDKVQFSDSYPIDSDMVIGKVFFIASEI